MAEYYFGLAGWSYPDWEGVVYPSGASRGFDQLGYVAQFFDVIELNNTFYRIPESKTVENWVRRVRHNPRFRFTAKVFQGFTHDAKSLDETELKQFLQAMEPLQKGDRLGGLLLQFPASFQNTPANRERLSELADRFGQYPLVVEFRHRSWDLPTVLEWLSTQKIGFCNVDEPRFRHLMRPSAHVTSPIGYVRFHGRNYQNWYSKEATRDSRYDYLYSDLELDEWVPRIEEMGKESKQLYVIGNNHFRGQAPANILQLKSKVTEGPVSVPEPMLKSYPNLQKIAGRRKEDKGQRSLFDTEEEP